MVQPHQKECNMTDGFRFSCRQARKARNSRRRPWTKKANRRRVTRAEPQEGARPRRQLLRRPRRRERTATTHRGHLRAAARPVIFCCTSIGI